MNENVPQIELAVGQDRYKPVTIHHRVTVSHQGSLAIELTKLAVLATVPSGHNDTNGQPIQRILTPQEVVDRAVDIAETVFKQIAAKGWATDIPSLADLKDESTNAGFKG